MAPEFTNAHVKLPLAPQLKGRGLFVFSDPGGAKPILSYICLNDLKDSVQVFSNRTYDFFADFGIVVRNVHESSDTILDQVRPDYVFTGTSYTTKLEIEFLRSAKLRKLPTYSFVDHYTNYDQRFLSDAGDLILPDCICVTDERARNIADTRIKNSANQTTILVTGNYYHSFLAKWQPTMDRKELMQSLGIPLKHKLIVFAPDPLSNIGGVEKWGCDEVTVWYNLKEALRHLKTNAGATCHFSLVATLHPNQNENFLLPHLLDNDTIPVTLAKKTHLNTLLAHADLIVGMFSSILVEATVMGKAALRCTIGLSHPDPLEGVNAGKKAGSEEVLRNALEQSLGN